MLMEQANPLAIRIAARESTLTMTWRGLAPSAVRRPISRVRRETLTARRRYDDLLDPEPQPSPKLFPSWHSRLMAVAAHTRLTRARAHPSKSAKQTFGRQSESSVTSAVYELGSRPSANLLHL
jgi:hypothetical protein